MEDKELTLTEEQIESIKKGTTEKLDIKCPYCGSSNIIPFHSPSKGTAFLCGDCYRSITIKK